MRTSSRISSTGSLAPRTADRATAGPVVYRPLTERYSHYFEARLASQFDAVVHVDRTRAVEPLERSQVWTAEPPGTYPSAL